MSSSKSSVLVSSFLSSSSLTCQPCSTDKDNEGNDDDHDDMIKDQQQPQQPQKKKLRGRGRPPPPPPPPVPTDWTRCHMYLPQKRRYCRQEPVPIAKMIPHNVTTSPPDTFLTTDSSSSSTTTTACTSTIDPNNNKAAAPPRYCGNHQPFSFNDNNHATINGPGQQQLQRIRIPCPFDKTHSIYKDQIDRHSRICPALKMVKAQRLLDCYRHNINAGGHGSLGDGGDGTADVAVAAGVAEVAQVQEPQQVQQQPHQQQVDSNGTSSSSSSSFVWAQHLALRVVHVSQQLGLFDNDDDDSSKSKIPLADLATPLLLQRLESGASYYNLKSGGSRHLHQQASLIGHVLRCINQQGEEGGGGRETCDFVSNNNNVDTNNNNNNKTEGGGEGETKTRTSTGSSQPPPPPQLQSTTTILEVGAGRGMAGLLAAGIIASSNSSRSTSSSSPTTATSAAATTTTRLILVDRGGARSKADTVLRRAKSPKYYATAKASSSLNLGQIDWSRVTCDIKHVDMRALLQRRRQEQQEDEQHQHNESPTPISNNNGKNNDNHHPKQQQEKEKQVLVLLAKHLCGSGTDLALASLGRIRNEITACVLATCCHGLCTWDDYVGRDHLALAFLPRHLGTTTTTTTTSCMPKKQEDRDDKECQLEQQQFTSFGRPEFELLCRWSAGTVSCGCAKKVNPGSSSSSNSSTIEEPEPATSVVVDEEALNEDVCDDYDGGGDDDAHGRNKRPVSSSEGCGSSSSRRPDLSDSFNIAKIVDSLQLECGPSGLGRACQRLIDYGRREYLRADIFLQDAPYVELLHYVPASVTPQNAVLVASKIIPDRSTPLDIV